MNPLKLALIVLLAMLLSACGDGLKGRYEGQGMLVEGRAIVFEGNGHATQMLNGMELQMEYEVDGDKIKLRNPEQPGTTFVLTRTDADTLTTEGPMGPLTFKRAQ